MWYEAINRVDAWARRESYDIFEEYEFDPPQALLRKARRVRRRRTAAHSAIAVALLAGALFTAARWGARAPSFQNAAPSLAGSAAPSEHAPVDAGSPADVPVKDQLSVQALMRANRDRSRTALAPAPSASRTGAAGAAAAKRFTSKREPLPPPEKEH